MDEREPIYAIAVAARLTRMHPQTLRKYERAGLLRPARQSGNQRLYSNSDLRRLERIRYLVEQRGLNIAGVEMTLGMVDRLESVEGGSSAAQMKRAIYETISMSGASRAPASPGQPTRRDSAGS